jgi:hypothetical protein
MNTDNDEDEISMIQKEIKRLRIVIKRSPAPIDEGTLIELHPRGNDEDTGGEDAPRITICPLRGQLESALHRQAELEELARVTKAQQDAVTKFTVWSWKNVRFAWSH